MRWMVWIEIGYGEYGMNGEMDENGEETCSWLISSITEKFTFSVV